MLVYPVPLGRGTDRNTIPRSVFRSVFYLNDACAYETRHMSTGGDTSKVARTLYISTCACACI